MNRPIWAALAMLVVAGGVSAQRVTHYDIAAATDSGLKSTVAIDLATYNGGIWLATGKGLQFSLDTGLTWLQYSSANGLVSNNVSAICPVGDSLSGFRFWIATNHNIEAGGQLAEYSDGPSFTNNGGSSWNQVDFGSTGQNIPYVWGGDRTIFDITGMRDSNTYNNSGTDWMFFTAFAGGFLASRDGGVNWRRIFASPSDSIQFNTPGQPPSLRNRYFSCVVDSSHGDSTFVWAGTAGGVFQYMYVQPREKLYSRAINRVAFCSTCGIGTKTLIGGSGGLSIGKITGGPFVTRFTNDGLPGNLTTHASYITAVREFGGKVFVGTASDSVNSKGLAVSTDGGNSFAPVSIFPPPHILSISDAPISDFAAVRNRLYLAGQQWGLYVSSDTGVTWSHVYINSVDSFSAINAVNALDVWMDTLRVDTLRVGTDSGLALIAMDSLGTFLNTKHVPFAEDDSTSRRVIRVRTQKHLNPVTPVLVDSTTIWTCNLKATPAGRAMVGRLYTDMLGNIQFYHHQTNPTGQEAITYDVNFLDDTVIVVGRNGARYSAIGENPTANFSVIDSVSAALKLDNDTITTLEVCGDTLVVGSKYGVAFSTNRGKKFKVYRAKLDPLSADLVVTHTVLNSTDTTAHRYGLTGDFVPAMAVRNAGSGLAEVWFSGRPVDFGTSGICKTWVDPAGRFKLLSMNETDFAWNFEFVGDTVYAATNAGLLRHIGRGSIDTAQLWDTVMFVDTASSDTLIAPGTPVYAVKKSGNYLWVGTNDGTVRIDLANTDNQKLFTPVDSTTSKDEVYAFPVPFFPAEGDEVDFHFVVDKSGPVTLEVYDFAMNLVARPIDNISYAAGIYPNGSTQGRTWDGRNGRGDVVAVGVYYFKVTLPGSEYRWGKIAVLP